MSRQSAVSSRRAVVSRSVRTLGLLALVLPCGAALSPTADFLSTVDRRLRTHDVHVTLTRMAVDSAAIVSRIRLFKDDLQLGLRKFHKLPQLDLGTSKDTDSLFSGYLAERVWVEADGVRLRGTVQASGVEADEQGQPMIWFVVEYAVGAPPRKLGIRNDLLFEMFPSQQNIVNLLHVATDRRYSLYFVPGSTKLDTVSF
jgi:hypothetical protein